MTFQMPDPTLEELREAELRDLRASLARAYQRVPHHRVAFDEAGVGPDDLRSLADLARFPFTTKADLRENYPFGMFAVPREQVSRIHASSGTTGKPTVVGYTRADLDVWADLMARSIHAAGGRPGDIVHVAYGYGLFTGGLGAHYGAERLGCTVVPVSGGMTERQVHYGLSEVMGPGVSQESVTTKDGPHVWEDHFYPEVIDPVTHEVLPDGEEGELVFTSLTKQAMPVVRYRTRDLTRLLPGTAFPSSRRMQKVTGRTDDMMILRGVNVFPSQIEEQILKVEGLSPHYLCVLTRPGNLDVVDPGALERSLGKAKRISDRRTGG